MDPELGLVRWCPGCADWLPVDAEFWYFEPKRPTVAHCRACKSEARTRRKPHICPRCLVVRTQNRECHGCAGRSAGPLTVEKLREWGLAPVVS